MDAFFLQHVTAWFEEYTNSFRGLNHQLDDAVTLKYEHTKRVCAEMEALVATVDCTGEFKTLSHLAALFHDVARYAQFKKYGTFSDRKSEDHAAMAVEILIDLDVLDGLSDSDKATLLAAIRYHNAIAIPSVLENQAVVLCKLLRDADKLDIYKVALDHYINPDPRRSETVQVGIPEGTTVTPEVCDYVLQRKIVPYEMIKTVADFKMIQLGWVFDLNFPYSLKCVQDRGYIQAIKNVLPLTPEVLKTVTYVEAYLLAETRALP